MLAELIKELQSKKDLKRARSLQRFFKSEEEKGKRKEFFLGIPVPELRRIAKKYLSLSLPKLQKMLHSKVHEYRLTALLILCLKYENSNDENEKSRIADFYIKNIRYVNNWDLVDLSAPNILGKFLIEKDKKVLYKLAESKNPWERRVAIVSCYEFIKRNKFEEALRISKVLLRDKDDSVQKAVGWMLREIGKRELKKEEDFLKRYHTIMPRTMLRYAVEKLPDKKKRGYLKK